ncbi:MAG TPA: zinc ribbon domain-containing protein [Thermomicrobiales bacterium]|nr:zinc ribbon domain-containing protein [Thermomicrobiales bacterium]
MTGPTDADIREAEWLAAQSPSSGPVGNDEELTCPECGGAIGVDDVICPHCGVPLVGG